MNIFRSKAKLGLPELVEACQRQDGKAQTQLYERYKGKLIGICLRYAKTQAEAEDIFQEGILKIFQNIGEIKNPEALDSWVKTIMIRHAINYYHQVTKKENRNITFENETIDWETTDHEDIFSKFGMSDILECVNALPDGYRLVINMYFIDGYAHTEIAQMLQIAESTSRSQLLRGRNLLIKKLEKKGIGKHEAI
jgi:RNA polymerase sigma factor (sigma-70 family)